MQNIIANWPAPNNICGLTTTRIEGASKNEYAYNNLGMQVNDDNNDVMLNRAALRTNLNLPAEPFWLKQTHTNICTEVTNHACDNAADAAITRNTQIPLVILTADCVPILICNRAGTEIAAIHAGWKGLVGGIIENTVKKFSEPAANYLAWIGPAICKDCYETGDEIKQQFLNKYAYVQAGFSDNYPKTHTDLPKIAEIILQKHGVNQVYQSNNCTFAENDKFYSYRRQAKTGRIATLIWFKDGLL